jgi:hypothetical protein
MQSIPISHNGQLIGFIEYDGKSYTAVAVGVPSNKIDEIICKNYGDAIQFIYDAHEIQ